MAGLRIYIKNPVQASYSLNNKELNKAEEIQRVYQQQGIPGHQPRHQDDDIIQLGAEDEVLGQPLPYLGSRKEDPPAGSRG